MQGPGSVRNYVKFLEQAKVASKACAARVRQREQELMKTRIRNMKPQARSVDLHYNRPTVEQTLPSS